MSDSKVSAKPPVAKRVARIFEKIRASGLTIYAPIKVDDPDYWYANDELEAAIAARLIGHEFGRMPTRSRSKEANGLICEALGYPRVASFQRTVPRFPGQNFDKYVQASDNLQIWNQEIDPGRRYVVIGLDGAGTVRAVRVATGTQLALYDTTGTLTKKYQARGIPPNQAVELVVTADSSRVAPHVNDKASFRDRSPSSDAESKSILPIRDVGERLRPMIGKRIKYDGQSMRSGGDLLHRMASEHLGYANHADDGQFPDLRHQLLEVKLQTAPTIDLGLVDPASESAFGHRALSTDEIRPSDVRYGVFFGRVVGGEVELEGLVLSTGAAFFTRFERFGGMGVNSKLQLHLPDDFYDSKPKGA